MDSENLLELFAQSFKDSPDELEGYTYEKIFNRAEQVDTQDNMAIFEIERHRAILGETYSKGRGMASYITYWPRFASFYCTRLDDGSNKIDESCGGYQAILNDASEIRRFVESIVDSWDIAESLSNELSDDLSNDEIERHAATLHECVTEELEQMATRAWKDCENEANV